MKRRHDLTELEWELLAPLIPRAATGRLRVSDRQVINGMVYRIRAQDTLFRLQPVGEGFRFLVVTSGRCVGVADAKEGAEASEQRCGDSADQRFLVRRD